MTPTTGVQKYDGNKKREMPLHVNATSSTTKLDWNFVMRGNFACTAQKFALFCCYYTKGYRDKIKSLLFYLDWYGRPFRNLAMNFGTSCAILSTQNSRRFAYRCRANRATNLPCYCQNELDWKGFFGACVLKAQRLQGLINTYAKSCIAYHIFSRHSWYPDILISDDAMGWNLSGVYEEVGDLCTRSSLGW